MTIRKSGLCSAAFAFAVFNASCVAGIGAVQAGGTIVDAGRYDAGYASAAAANCPNTQLRVALGADAFADADFKRGGDMFVLFVKQMGNETACKMALNLYDEKTGKVAPLLGRK